MIATQSDLTKRILYILHCGFVEARNLAYAGRSEQIAELADAMEILPRCVSAGSEEDREMVRFVLKNYQDKHPAMYDYLAYLEDRNVPESY